MGALTVAEKSVAVEVDGGTDAAEVALGSAGRLTEDCVDGLLTLVNVP